MSDESSSSSPAPVAEPILSTPNSNYKPAEMIPFDEFIIPLKCLPKITVFVGTFYMSFDFTDPENTHVKVLMNADESFMGFGFWKMEAHLKFISKNTKDLEPEKCVWDQYHNTHTFDSSALNVGTPANKLTSRAVFANFKKIEGFGINARPWNYNVSGPDTDVCLICGKSEKRIYQNKRILAYHSSYFKAIFFGSFSEGNQDEYKLKEAGINVMTKLIDVIHGSAILQADDLQLLLHFADKFDIPIVTQRCQDYLLKDTTMSNTKKLQMADRYRLAQVLGELMPRLTSDDIANIATDPKFQSLSVYTTMAIIKLDHMERGFPSAE